MTLREYYRLASTRWEEWPFCFNPNRKANVSSGIAQQDKAMPSSLPFHATAVDYPAEVPILVE